MDHKIQRLMICLIFSILFCVPSFRAYADDDHKGRKSCNKTVDGNDDDQNHHQKRKRYRHRDGDHHTRAVKPVTDPVYQNECGACHFAYQPEFLPESSWLNLLANLDDHFGESVEMAEDSKKAVTAYLKLNCAENSQAKHAAKIMNSLKNNVPLRITEIPYISKEHHKISSSVFNRDAIGSFSNCIACHTTAEDGIYDDDNVKIPE